MAQEKIDPFAHVADSEHFEVFETLGWVIHLPTIHVFGQEVPIKFMLLMTVCAIAVGVAMVVLEPEAASGSGQHPGARAVVADEEGNADPVRVALANVHDQGLAGERIGAAGWWRVGDDAPCERASAQAGDVAEELVGRRGGGAGGGSHRRRFRRHGTAGAQK